MGVRQSTRDSSSKNIIHVTTTTVIFRGDLAPSGSPSHFKTLPAVNCLPIPQGRADHSEPGRFVLVLRSAVCHLGGESVSKGHYVAYSADRVTSGGGSSGGGGKKGEAGGAHAAKAGDW